MLSFSPFLLLNDIYHRFLAERSEWKTPLGLTDAWDACCCCNFRGTSCKFIHRRILIFSVSLLGGKGLWTTPWCGRTASKPRNSQGALVSPPAEYFSWRILILWNRAGFAGAFVDREVETKGVSILLFFVHFLQAQFCNLQLDWIDRKRAKDAGKQPHRIIALTSCLSSLSATKQLHNEYDNRYGDQ